MNPRLRRDDGSIIPLVALCMFALLVVLALVIDFGATRSLRRDTRTGADAGSTAGAVGIGSDSPIERCVDAFTYTFHSLGGTQPSITTVNSTCAGMATDCTGTAPRTASLTVDGVTVRVTNPVPDGSPLMNGTSLGGGVTQTVDPASDGVPCERIGVEVTREQPAFFRGILGSGASTFTVHSVAVKTNKPGKGKTTPALVALNQTACKTIDTGNGEIWLIGNANGPGIGVSDSDGSACANGPILSGGSSGHLCSESSAAGVGELQWFQAPPSKGYSTGDANYTGSDAVCANATSTLKKYRYIGVLSARSERITRDPVDTVYRCSDVNDPDTGQPVCSTAADPVLALETLSNNSGSSAPAGYLTYPSASFTGDCNNTSGTTFASNTWVNCASFPVKGGIVSITNGATVIFNGNLSVESGGDLRANAGTTTDADGYPIPTDASKQTTIIVNGPGAGSFSMQSSAANIRLAQTTVFNKGGYAISGSPVIRWTPPTAGGTFGLLYWSESNQQFGLSGSPSIFAKGVFFQGNGKLFVSGGGLIDLTKVQMWVDTIGISGGGGVKLSADPETAIAVGTPGSSLIR